MKRFNVSNIHGFQFVPVGESLELLYPKGLPPEWGKPERWVRDNGAEDVSLALETREVEGLHGEIIVEYKLPAEFSIVVEDITEAFETEKIQRLRASEYPSLGDFADAFVKERLGDPAQMQEYVAKCQAVKTKYPKPTKGPK